MKDLIEEIADKYVSEDVQGEKAREMAAWELLSTCSRFEEVERYY